MDEHQEMDNEQRIALAWIRTVESEGARVRDSDIYPLIGRWVEDSSPVEILEIGAGQGVCSDKIDLRGRRYTGLEPSALLLERATALYGDEHRRFVQGSVYSLPFADGAFDAVFSVAVWHLLGDLQKAAGEMSRVLGAGGRFLIITANPAAYPFWTGLYTEARTEGRRFEGTVRLPDGSALHEVLYLHTRDEILISLRDAGLAVEAMETFRPAEKAGGQDAFLAIRGGRERAPQR